MLIKIKFLSIIIILMSIFACTSKEESKKADAETKSDSENKYTVSLKEAAEKFSKAEQDHDTSSFFSYIDSSFGVTVRGEAHVVPGSKFADFKKSMTDEFTDTAMTTVTTYDIKNAEAGSADPVWAGYDQGTFTQTTKSKDGKYGRKVSGPFYRAWKLDNGHWKCYQVVYMAFTCEGNDCK